jgi:hypothetical protein
MSNNLRKNIVVFIRNDAQTLKQALIRKNAATEQYMFYFLLGMCEQIH